MPPNPTSLAATKATSDVVARPVLFFDGECGLCHALVRLLLRLDRHAVMRFAPLQGATAKSYLQSQGLPLTDFDSLVFVPDWTYRDRREFLLRTDGAIAAVRAIGRARFLLFCLKIIPARLRDAGYRLVARWRHHLFGWWRPEPLPHPEWKARFLD